MPAPDVWEDTETDVWEDTLVDVWQDIDPEAAAPAAATAIPLGLLLGVYP